MADIDVNKQIIGVTADIFRLKSLTDAALALLTHECAVSESDEAVVSARHILEMISASADESATVLMNIDIPVEALA